MCSWVTPPGAANAGTHTAIAPSQCGAPCNFIGSTGCSADASLPATPCPSLLLQVPKDRVPSARSSARSMQEPYAPMDTLIGGERQVFQKPSMLEGGSGAAAAAGLLMQTCQPPALAEPRPSPDLCCSPSQHLQGTRQRADSKLPPCGSVLPAALGGAVQALAALHKSWPHCLVLLQRHVPRLMLQATAMPSCAPCLCPTWCLAGTRCHTP